MKSQKAKEFLEMANVILNDEGYTSIPSNNIIVFDNATHAVELAEQEMIEKAIEAFCSTFCNRCKYGYRSDCEKLNEFINRLNDK